MKRVSLPDVALFVGLAAAVAGVWGLAGGWWALLLAGFLVAAMSIVAGAQ